MSGMSDGSDNEDKISERYLQCGQCGVQYGTGSRSPRILPCLHSYCLGCLEGSWDWASTGITCQICNASWDVHGSISGTFPVNYVAMKLLTLAKVENSRAVRCTDCIENKAATHRCMECQHFVCAEGYQAHQQFVQLTTHRLLSIADFLKSPSEMFRKDQTCPVHVHQPLDLYCQNVTCKQPICASCALTAHKEREGHNVGRLKDKYLDLSDRCRALIEDIFIKLGETQEELKSTEVKVKRLEERADDIKMEISQVFEDITEAIRERKSSLMKAVDDVIEKERTDQKQLTVRTCATDTKIREAIEYANQALSVCSYVEFLGISPLLEEMLTRFQQESVLFHCVEKDIQLDRSLLEDIKTNISKFGDIVESCANSYSWQPVVEVIDSHPGHETNIMEIKFLNEINKAASREVPKVEVKVERCEPPVGARILRLQSHGEHRKAAYKVRFSPPRDVTYRTKLKIGHTRLLHNNFSFRCIEERGDGRDRAVYIAQQQGGAEHKWAFLLVRCDGRDRAVYIAQQQGGAEHKWAFLLVRCPHIRLSEDTVNIDWCRIRERTVLLNKPSMKQVLDSPIRLRSYPGAVATATINMEGKCYWEVLCRTQVKQRWWGSIFEAGIARRAAMDTPYIVGYSPYGWTLQVVYCTVHRSVCAQARNNRQTLYDLPVITEDLDSVLEVHLGFLMDFDSSALHVLDVHHAQLVYTFSEVDTSKQLWPFCGIFNNNWYSTEVKVLSGADISLDHQHLRLIESLCNTP